MSLCRSVGGRGRYNGNVRVVKRPLILPQVPESYFDPVPDRLRNWHDKGRQTKIHDRQETKREMEGSRDKTPASSPSRKRGQSDDGAGESV